MHEHTLCLTFYNFLRIIQEEFTEWWSLWPFECIQQLLDLGGHPTVDRHAWTNDKATATVRNNPNNTAHGHTCNLIASQIQVTSSHILTQVEPLALARRDDQQREGFRGG